MAGTPRGRVHTCSEGQPRADLGAYDSGDGTANILANHATGGAVGGGQATNSSTAVRFGTSQVDVRGVAKLTANDFIFA